MLQPLAGVSKASHRIEHIETLSREQAGRFGRIGVIASMQPSHCSHTLSADQSDNWSRRLGQARARRAFPQRDILDSGGTIAFGSDWPMGPFDPREIMAAARLRRPAGRPDTAPIIPEQAVTANEALDAYTRAPALIGGRALDEGAVEVGLYATLTAFATDPLAVSADELATVRSSSPWCGANWHSSQRQVRHVFSQP